MWTGLISDTESTTETKPKTQTKRNGLGWIRVESDAMGNSVDDMDCEEQGRRNDWTRRNRIDEK